ncbi:MAG TPA: GerMN domain-containing protein [Longimicrobiales bacterium]|nr:GerMN domain-containing protein [Longimicrobiales bacterium]
MTRRVLLVLLLGTCARAPDSAQEAVHIPDAAAQCPELDMAQLGSPAFVAVYFSCERASPGALSPVLRNVSTAETPLAGAVAALLAGPTHEEREDGYHSYFTEATANNLIGVRVNESGDTAWLNFRDFSASLPDEPNLKSLLPPGVMAELTWTLFQSFPNLQAVHFAFDGSAQAFWQWLGSEPRVFTREEWQRI